MHSDKPKSAIGLQYSTDDDDTQAPTVIAKGFGDLAEEIIQVARDNGVLIHEDEELAAILSRLDLGQEIPTELYYVIAELIAFAYVLQGKFPPGWQETNGRVDLKS